MQLPVDLVCPAAHVAFSETQSRPFLALRYLTTQRQTPPFRPVASLPFHSWQSRLSRPRSATSVSPPRWCLPNHLRPAPSIPEVFRRESQEEDSQIFSRRHYAADE